MKLKKSDINLLIILLGVVIAVLAYFLVYTKFNEKTDILNAENATLQTEVDYLQDLADHKQQYIDETESMQAEIDEIKAQFPAKYQPEDDIMYIKGLEKDYDSFVSVLGMGNSAVIEVEQPVQELPTATETTDDVDSVDEETEAAAAPAATTAVQPDILLYSTPLTLTMTSSYNSVKDIIEKINTDRDRKSIEQLALSFDTETGDLTVSMAFNAYSLTGTEKTYDEPVIEGVRFGTNNIFNSADKKKAVEAEKEAAKAAKEAEATEE